MKKYISKKLTIRLLLLKMLAAGIILGLIAILFVYVNKGPAYSSNYSRPRKVVIKKADNRYNFYIDGKPFIVKGGSGYTHLAELAASGGNTISCWDTSKFAHLLDEALQHHLYVIAGLDIPGGENDAYYKNETKVSALFNKYQSLVQRYKDHPALLAWGLGNELKMPFSFSTSPYYKTYNRLLTMMHRIDPNHPVSTSVINIPKKGMLNIQWRIPALDFISLNVYNSIKTIDEELAAIKMIWKGPYLIGEWAPRGGWEAETITWQAPIEKTSTKKAEEYAFFYKQHMPVKDPRFLGSITFYWGYRQEYTPTWYSVFSENGEPNEIMEALNDCWKDTQTVHISPRLKYMLFDDLGAADNIIVSPGTMHKARLLFEGSQPADSLRYCWEILNEDWVTWGSTWNNFKKPKPEIGLVADSTVQNPFFKTPDKEGPYRIYITVSNSSGFCATANTPFYVVK